MSIFAETKKLVLTKRRDDLIEEYETLAEALRQTLNPVDRLHIQKQMDSRETEITELERQIALLEVSRQDTAVVNAAYAPGSDRGATPLMRPFSFLPEFNGRVPTDRQRIFISYAPEDDVSSVDARGYVSRLADVLYKALNGDGSATLTNDSPASAAVYGSIPISEYAPPGRLPEGAVPIACAAACLLVVLSKHYLQCPNAMAELKAYQEQWWQENPGKSQADLSVLFVEKEQVSEDDLRMPTELAILSANNRMALWPSSGSDTDLVARVYGLLKRRWTPQPSSAPPGEPEEESPLVFVFYHPTERDLAETVCRLLTENRYEYKRPWDDGDTVSGASGEGELLDYCRDNVLKADAIFVLWRGADPRYHSAVLRWAERQIDYCKPLVRRRSRGLERPFMDRAGILWGIAPPPKPRHPEQLYFSVPGPQFCFLDCCKGLRPESFARYLRLLRRRLLRFRQTYQPPR